MSYYHLNRLLFDTAGLQQIADAIADEAKPQPHRRALGSLYRSEPRQGGYISSRVHEGIDQAWARRDQGRIA